MVQSSRRLERHVGSPAQANEFNHTRRSRKFIAHLAARPNLGSAPATGNCRDVFRTIGQRKFEIYCEPCRNDRRKPRDLFHAGNFHLNGLNDGRPAGPGTRHSIIEFANSSLIRNYIRAHENGEPPSESRSDRWWESAQRFFKLPKPRNRNNETSENPIPL